MGFASTVVCLKSPTHHTANVDAMTLCILLYLYTCTCMCKLFIILQGALVEAIRHGWWILLDEINLATPETLQCLSSLLEDSKGTFILTEKL